MKIKFSNNVDFSTELKNSGADEYVKVVPYCDAPQVDANGNRVTQRFAYEDACALVDTFRNNAKRLARKFGAMLGLANNNIPFYDCHADAEDTEPANHTVFAEATDLEAREDGLYAKIQRFANFDKLKELLGTLQISPYWTAESTDGKIYRPTRLISFGMVKKGNLPNACLINTQLEMDAKLMGQCAELLGIKPEEFTGDILIEKVKNALESVTKLDEANKKADELNKQVQTLTTQNTNYKEQIGEYAINEALAQGKILPEEADDYRAKMGGDMFDATVQFLRSAKPAMTNDEAEDKADNGEQGDKQPTENDKPADNSDEEKKAKEDALKNAEKGSQSDGELENLKKELATEIEKLQQQDMDYTEAFTVFASTTKGQELLKKIAELKKANETV